MAKIDLCVITDWFVFFQEYVAEVCEYYNAKEDCRPKSFDEWYTLEMLPHKNDYLSTVVLEVRKAHADQLLFPSQFFECDIPRDIVTESGGIVDLDLFRTMGKRLLEKLDFLDDEFIVFYGNKLLYGDS
jgi:hypothetical protein